jgi:membrane-bound ClpP family serine protease
VRVTLELVYWVTLGVGLSVLAISVLFGEILELLDIELGDTSLPVVPVFFAAVSTFGAGGLLGIYGFELGRGGSIAAGLGTGVVGGGLAALLFALLRRQEGAEGFDLASLVGERGRCTLTVGPDRVGRVSVQHAGMTRSFSARSDEEIHPGEEVVIRDVVAGTVTVSRQDRAERSS